MPEPESWHIPTDIPIARVGQFAMRVLFSLVGILLVAMYVPFTLIGVFYNSPTAYKTTMLGVLVVPALIAALVLYWRGRDRTGTKKSSLKRSQRAPKKRLGSGHSGRPEFDEKFFNDVLKKIKVAKANQEGLRHVDFSEGELTRDQLRELDLMLIDLMVAAKCDLKIAKVGKDENQVIRIEVEIFSSEMP